MVRALLAMVAAAAALSSAPPQFREHTIATELRGGYQVVVFDVNRDGRPDLIALASGMTDLVWFENPGWRRHVLGTGLARMINLAACEGMDEIVVAHEFANQPEKSIGIVSVLQPGPDRTLPWKAREIDRLTTSHRLRCADVDGSGRVVVVNAPLAGAQAAPPDYRDRVPLVFYRPGVWKRELIGEENEGVVHGIHVVRWNTQQDSILTASFLGIHRHEADRNGKWIREELAKGNPEPWPRSGASDVAAGRLGTEWFLAAIEPWHGNRVAIYTELKGVRQRQVIDESLVDGHTLVTADLNGDGRDEVVAGFRGTGRSVYLYQQDGAKWNRRILDDGGIAAAGCAAADLNGDGRVDITCIGSATANLKVYENLRD